MNKIFKIKFSDIIIPFLGGLLYASGFPLLGKDILFPIGPILSCLIILNYFDALNLRNTKLTKMFSALVFFSIGYYALGFYWIPFTIKEFGGIFFPFNHLLGVLFSFIILPHFYFLIIFILGLKYLKNTYNILFLNEKKYLSVIISIILTVLEQVIPQQFPARIGNSWLSLAPYLGLGPIFGASIYSFFSIWISLTILQYVKYKEINLIAIIMSTLFIIFNVILPLKIITNKTILNIRIVQANIGNNAKINAEKGSSFSLGNVLRSYYQLSTAQINFKPDLIIWPETSYPLLLNSNQIINNPRKAPSVIKKVIKDTHANFFFGGYDQVSSKKVSFESEFNSAFLFNRDGVLSKSYNKIKLIPFGEKLPFGPLNHFLSKYINNISYFAKGKKLTLFSLDTKHTFSSFICYEILFSNFVRSNLNTLPIKPNFLINITNDSWYGNTSEPYQHLFLSKWRAIEFNIPIIRSTNTGITSILYPNGDESKRITIGKKDKLDLSLSLPIHPITPYQRYGHIPLFLLWLIIIIVKVSTKKNLI